jgi:hypothetical protein
LFFEDVSEEVVHELHRKFQKLKLKLVVFLKPFVAYLKLLQKSACSYELDIWSPFFVAKCRQVEHKVDHQPASVESLSHLRTSLEHELNSGVEGNNWSYTFINEQQALKYVGNCTINKSEMPVLSIECQCYSVGCDSWPKCRLLLTEE